MSSSNGTTPIKLDVNAILAQHSEPIRIGDVDYLIRPIPARAQHLLAQLAAVTANPQQAQVICQAAALCLTPAITPEALLDESFAVSLFVVRRSRAADEKLQAYFNALNAEEKEKNVSAPSEGNPGPALTPTSA